MEIQLSKDADKVVCCIYKEYLERRKSGIAKRNATHFDANFYSHDKKLSGWNRDDFLETIAELKRAGLLSMYIGGAFAINENLIIYMENRFKNGLNEVADFISKLIP